MHLICFKEYLINFNGMCSYLIYFNGMCYLIDFNGMYSYLIDFNGMCSYLIDFNGMCCYFLRVILFPYMVISNTNNLETILFHPSIGPKYQGRILIYHLVWIGQISIF